MATAVVSSGASPNTVSDEERRWMVVGICLNKVLTPALRDVLAKEMPLWYRSLLPPPDEIDKQTHGRYIKNFPHSTLPNLNYKSINNNSAKRKPPNYDYAVKDPESLAKLFLLPSMASFTGFDHTMDTSAALSVVAEAQPFHASGAGGMATKIRSDVRNEWAHCNFVYWTDVTYEAALNDMEILIHQINLTPAEKKQKLDDLDSWKQKGLDLCFGRPVDPELLNLVIVEVAELRDSVKVWKDDIEFNQSKLLNSLETIKKSLTQDVHELKKNVEQLRVGQLALYDAISRKHEEEPRHLFMAPQRVKWFSGRESELDFLRDILENETTRGEEKVIVAAVSGLGGSGKTSLTGEYIHKWKNYYKGGVYWFSGEDDVKLKSSVDDIAAQFNTLHGDDSLDATLSKTLAVFSRITKPWLMIIDDMDGLKLSKKLLKLVSGSWQANTAGFGNIVITTRRTPRELNEDISRLKESRCLKLDIFGCEEAKNFVFKRTSISRDELTEVTADHLYKKLGGLPLALEQACAYIASLECTLSQYLETYEKQSLKLLNMKKASSPFETSPERLAVRTTWLLNFEHIRRNENGMIAIRFLNASAFMNRNEIQKELINIGKPRVDDKAYCDHLSSPLGSLEVLKLLTDFSLFKKSKISSLSVHRLVQEVIREDLTPEGKVESIVDASRLLRFAFLKCPSPDTISESEVIEYGDRSSLHPIDSSRFYKWHKLCLHAHEIKGHLESLLDILRDVNGNSVFLPEIARAIYECALHLNVNNSSSEAKVVGDFANRILDWSCNEISEDSLKVLFPHMLPLSEPIRRLIQYSCKAPVETCNATSSKSSFNDSTKSEIEKMRLEGNKLFMESKFDDAIEKYSSCINSSKETDSFDPMFLSNRSSAYLWLKQYNDALQDAEEYIKYSPECWRGYAKKALALLGLNKRNDAVCAAAIAYDNNRDIFESFVPFKVWFSNLQHCIHDCANVHSLISLLSPCPPQIDSDSQSKIILLKPGEYRLSANDFGMSRIKEDTLFHINIKRLLTGGFCIVGVRRSSSERDVILTFASNFGLLSHNIVAANISFVFELGNWCTVEDSVVELFNCSFTSKLENRAFVSKGNLSLRRCRFGKCKNTALSVLGEANIEDSVFHGNESAGLEVWKGGHLVLKNSKLHGNRWGLIVKHGTCDMAGCQVYDNKEMGIGVSDQGKVDLTRTEIFHNDHHGVFVCNKGSAVIVENEIYENGWSGIRAIDGVCRVSRNKIYANKCHGVFVVSVTKASGLQGSVIEFNQIFCNQGSGIERPFTACDDNIDNEIDNAIPSPDVIPVREDDVIRAKCIDNELKNNIERESDSPPKTFSDICFLCHKSDKKLGKIKKCNRCFIARYCNEVCQQVDQKKHEKHCLRLLEKYSVLVNVLPLSTGLIGDKQVNSDGHESLMPWSQLEPRGCAEAPKRGKCFVVKIQACDGPRRSNVGGTLLSIEDRSLTVNGGVDMEELHDSGRIYHLVRECGSNCENNGWKKKFFYALLGCSNNTVRVFTSDLPPYERW